MKNGYGIIFFGEGNEFNLQLFDDINKYRSKANQVVPLVYKGQWYRNEMNGDGILYLSNGSILYGQFDRNQLKDSVMQLRYPNGDTYAG